MSDITYTRKLGDGSVARPQASTAATAATATVANLPTGLANITTGALIKALVTAQNARGVTTLKTDKGTLSIQTHLSLKPGNELVLQVQSTGMQTRLVILSIDNHPVGGAKSGQANAPSRNPAAPAAIAGPSTAAKSAPPAAGGFPAKPTGSGNTAEGRTGIPGTPSPTPHAAVRPDSLSSVRSPLAAGLVLPGRVTAEGLPSVDLPGNNAPRVLSAGDTITVRILQAGPATQQVPPAPAGGQPLRATIVAHTSAAGGKNVESTTTLAVGTGRLTLPAPPPGPPGTEVTFQILDARKPVPPQTAGGAELHRDFLRLGTDWRALKEAVAVLTGATPTANAAEQTPVPRPGPQMASSMLFFMAALKGGDLGAWLGNHGMEHLGRVASGQLLAQLADDFQAMARHTGDAQPSGWQALAVPVATDQGIEQFRLYYRRHGTHGGEDGKEATHFVVEADLSRIGLLQLEGLVRPRQFDLTIHTTQKLGELTQTDIRRIFHEALSVGDLAGTLRFDVGTPVPFSPPGTTQAASRAGAAVVV